MDVDGENASSVMEASESELEETMMTVAEETMVTGAEESEQGWEEGVPLPEVVTDPGSMRYEHRCLQTSLSWNVRAERSKELLLRRSRSDCSHNSETAAIGGPVSITDEDLDELRGTIDLGFGFSEDSFRDPELHKTLPALQFCSAIEQVKEMALATPRSRCIAAQAHGASPPEGNCAGKCDCTASCAGQSALPNPCMATWNIPKPGDNPQSVKKTLRHWAQGVACITRIRYSLRGGRRVGVERDN